MKLTIDFETRSNDKLRDCGAARYAEGESTQIVCLAWKIDDDETQIWISPYPFGWNNPIPRELRAALDDPDCIVEAHNVLFEYHIYKRKLEPLGWPPIHPERWRDSMAASAHRSLPLSLDEVGIALDLDTRKDPRGKYLINALSKPKKATKKLPERFNEDPDLYMEFYDYCIQDVETEHTVSERVGDLPDSELDIFRLDFTANNRGVAIDTDAVDAALDLVEQAKDKLEAELFELTEGFITTGGQRDKIIEWLQSQSVPITDLQSETVDVLVGRTSGKAKRLLEIRQSLSKSSVTKLEKMKACTMVDGRARGLLQYSGAHRTGRWAGRLIQPQNFPRPNPEDDMDELIEAIRTRDIDAVEMYGPVLDIVSRALRGFIKAGEGKSFFVADFAQIEARVLAVLAKERDLIHAFENNEDVYSKLATEIYGRPINKKDNPDERFVGKEATLGLGYQMGAARFHDELEKKGAPQSMEFCQEVVDIFRGKYPRIKAMWNGIEHRALQACLHINTTCKWGDLKFRSDGENLKIKLPSGRIMYYNKPELIETTTPWGDPALKLTYMGYNNKTGSRKWARISTYGGMLTENIVQSVSRDILAAAMLRVERNKYPVVLTVHDEIICECANGDVAEFEKLMSARPDWASQYPIKAEGFKAQRYQK